MKRRNFGSHTFYCKLVILHLPKENLKPQMNVCFTKFINFHANCKLFFYNLLFLQRYRNHFLQNNVYCLEKYFLGQYLNEQCTVFIKHNGALQQQHFTYIRTLVNTFQWKPSDEAVTFKLIHIHHIQCDEPSLSNLPFYRFSLSTLVLFHLCSVCIGLGMLYACVWIHTKYSHKDFDPIWCYISVSVLLVL